MGEMRTMSVEVDEMSAAEVAHAVDSGDYADESAVVREALDLWSSTRQANIAWLRAAWQAGLDSGEPIPGNFDPEDIIRRGRERLAQRRA